MLYILMDRALKGFNLECLYFSISPFHRGKGGYHRPLRQTVPEPRHLTGTPVPVKFAWYGCCLDMVPVKILPKYPRGGMMGTVPIKIG